MNAIYELPSTHSWDDLTNLIDTVPFLHHQVLRQKLASLNRIIQRIAQNRVVTLSVMDAFERQFLAMAYHLETNMEEQECWLFAWLRRIVKRGLAIGPDNYLEESLAEAMDQAAAGNQEALVALDQFQMCFCGPEWMNKGILVEELIDHLRDLEEELAEYDHLEREELFPRVRKFCESCTKEEETSHAY
jgi:iron-sulfur cluster repair protein YtfE (RIC family)